MTDVHTFVFPVSDYIDLVERYDKRIGYTYRDKQIVSVLSESHDRHVVNVLVGMINDGAQLWAVERFLELVNLLHGE